MNIIIVSGRLGADVREYTTPSGKTVVHFPLAVRKSFKKDERGEYPVNYFKIEVWGAWTQERILTKPTERHVTIQ